jgi:hypothetical protein
MSEMSAGRAGQGAAAVTAAVVLSVAAALGIAPSGAHGEALPPSPYTPCHDDAQENLALLEETLGPSRGEVAVDSKVTLAGGSSQPVSFAVASSIPSLAEPDIDSGTGVPSASTPDEGEPVWSFESMKIAAIVHTVYWTASFSDAGIPACSEVEPTTYTTKPRELVVPPPPVAAVGDPAEGQVDVVPAVRGEPVARARLAIREAGFLVGRVRRPPRHRTGALVVVGERPGAGRKVPEGTRISLRLGEKARAS